MLIPTDTEPGVYTAFVSVTYEGNVYEGSKTFEIINQKNELSLFYILMIVMAIIIVILLFLLWKDEPKGMERRKERPRFESLSKMFRRNAGINIFHRSPTKQSNVKTKTKEERQQNLNKLALMSKKETAGSSYKSDIKYQNEEEKGGQQQSEVELIEEVVEETEEKNRKRETVEEMIEEADKAAQKEKQKKFTKRKRR